MNIRLYAVIIKKRVIYIKYISFTVKLKITFGRLEYFYFFKLNYNICKFITYLLSCNIYIYIISIISNNLFKLAQYDAKYPKMANQIY